MIPLNIEHRLGEDFSADVVLEVLAADLTALDDVAVGILLARLISAISEDSICAAWESGIEWRAWKWADDESLSGDWGVPDGWGVDIPENCKTALSRLRTRLAGAWVTYGEQGVVLLTAGEW